MEQPPNLEICKACVEVLRHAPVQMRHLAFAARVNSLVSGFINAACCRSTCGSRSRVVGAASHGGLRWQVWPPDGGLMRLRARGIPAVPVGVGHCSSVRLPSHSLEAEVVGGPDGDRVPCASDVPVEKKVFQPCIGGEEDGSFHPAGVRRTL